MNEDGGFNVACELEAESPDIDEEHARRTRREGSFAVCPYSNATRGNVEVKLSVI